ncbi:hypothetical protein [Chryseobacterium bernardetii]|uniref:hypothetical protein n=1 Tax=Chryseobacterium bernardetii TaxID=1241978 RepID=UPI0016233621|nr:hypothetical protein [Chryseobacterium bernardetii]
MKYTVGKYVIVPEKPFSSMEKAVQYIQEKHPELDVKTIEEYLMPKITNNGNDKSGNLSEENTVSQEVDAKDSSAVSDRVKPTSNKSR